MRPSCMLVIAVVLAIATVATAQETVDTEPMDLGDQLRLCRVYERSIPKAAAAVIAALRASDASKLSTAIEDLIDTCPLAEPIVTKAGRRREALIARWIDARNVSEDLAGWERGDVPIGDRGSCNVDGSWSWNARCKAEIRSRCFGTFSLDRELRFSALGEDFDLKRATVTSLDSFVSARAANHVPLYQRAQLEADWRFCTAVAANGGKIEETGLVLPPAENYPLLRADPIYLYGLKLDCPDNLSELRSNLDFAIVMMRHVPGQAKAVLLLKSWARQLEAREARCSMVGVVGGTCPAVEVIHGRCVLTYVTERCDLRHVTDADLRDDLKNRRKAGFTEGDALRHSELLELLSFCCEAANKHQLVWIYREPSIAKCNR